MANEHNLQELTEVVAEMASLRLSKKVSEDLAVVLSDELSDILQIECNITADAVAQSVFQLCKDSVRASLPGRLSTQ